MTASEIQAELTRHNAAMSADPNHPARAEMRGPEGRAFIRRLEELIASTPDEATIRDAIAEDPDLSPKFIQDAQAALDGKAPDEPEGYLRAWENQIPSGPRDEDLERQFAAAAHSLALPEHTAKGIVAQYVHLSNHPPDEKTRDLQRNEVWAALRQEWGNTFDRRIGAARRVIGKASNAEQLKTVLDRTGLGDNVHVIRWLADFGERKGI